MARLFAAVLRLSTPAALRDRTERGVPEGIAFATKAALAREMITRALDAGAPATWVTADQVYGQDPKLRAELARRGLGYVLAVAKTYPVRAPHPVPLAQLVRVAGSRWKIEDGFAAGKELSALDEHQARRWTSWHHWTILAPLTCAFLAVLAAARPHGSDPDDSRMIPLTRHEIRRLFASPHQQPPTPAMQLRWSRWRRRHQATARRCHDQRRQAPVPDPAQRNAVAAGP